MIFTDRDEAGRLLAKKLAFLADIRNAVVLALPRGGLPVGFAVAAELGLPLDVFIVRKIGVPGHEELAMGAIASGGTVIVNSDVVRMLHIDRETFKRAADRESIELERREKSYRGNKPSFDGRGKVCVLVDDGIATGASMLAAAQALRAQNPQQIIVSAPVAAVGAERQFGAAADRVVLLQTPADFFAVGAWYETFPQLTDSEVHDIL
ncbi:MAG TPA: phosphoribosyltransferase, partial [Candidatus Obscuribacterales bacterium]